jgi:hypothetical protein
MLTRVRLTALSLTMVLAACGTPDVDPAGSPPGEPVGSDGAGGGAAGACLEGTPDCVDADLSGDGEAPGPPAALDVASARRDAEALLGLPEDEAVEQPDVRIGRRGDEQMMLTEDWRPGRRTVATEDDGTGTYRVVEVVLELEVGTETFTADG